MSERIFLLGGRGSRRALLSNFAGAAALPFAVAAPPKSGFPIRDGQRVMFLGDSITNAGGYVQYLDLYLRLRHPSWNVELINLGLSSETVTGLTESDHPFPRPNLHERLDRALAKAKPNLVFACYGMNDGIYHPLDESRFSKYREGIARLVERVRAAAAQLILMTPPPFDAGPIADRLLPFGAANFGYKTPFVGYDDVLAEYARWLVRQYGKSLPVIDLHTSLKAHSSLQRTGNPKYTLAPDSVHPNATGQWLIARELLVSLGATTQQDWAGLDARALTAKGGVVTEFRKVQSAYEFKWTTRPPLPRDSAWDQSAPDLDPRNGFNNQHRLVISGLPHGRYTLWEGDRVLGSMLSAQLVGGLDLRNYPELITNRRAQEVLKLVRQRERLLSAAWLTAVGHQRPQTPAGLPLDEARAKADPLDDQLRKLCEPVTLAMKLVQMG